MNTRPGRALALAFLLALGACSGGSDALKPAPTEPAAPPVQDIRELKDFADLEPGAYAIDPDADPSTPLRVEYEVAAVGWSQWLGAVKFADDGHVAVSITTVSNLTTHACTDHSPADPQVGPGVDDLVTALTDLAPFLVTTPPTDIMLDGYPGKHLEWTVPDLLVEGEGDHREFARCVDGNLASWIGPRSDDEAFFGYNADPGFTEEFWILDVDGTRLMIAAQRAPGSPSQDLAEQRDILDSIRIES